MINQYKIKKWVKNGLKLGKNFQLEKGSVIDSSFPWLITIGDNVTLAPQVQVLSHDGSTKKQLNYTKIGLVHIGDNVFVGAKTIILPHVTIGENTVIAAGSIVSKDIPANSVAAGNPARVVCSIEEFTQRNKQKMKENNVFDYSYTRGGNISEEKKKQMIEILSKGMGYVD